MTLAVARIGDTFIDTDTIADGSGDVFANNIPIAHLGSMTLGHSAVGHTFYPPAPITSGSGSVFVNNKSIARLTDSHAIHCDIPHTVSDCHDSVISTASGDVFSG